MAQLAAASDPFLTEAGRQGRGDAQAGADARDWKAVAESIAMQEGPVPDGREKALYEEYKRQFDKVAKRESLVDAGSEMSFPASDPPSYMAGATVVGAPPPGDETREKATTKVSDPDEVKPSKSDVTNPPPGKKAEEAARGGKGR
ncbi:hypothetical protein [uncultured Alsobacter sp.]|uniref:hypothetical protein n=1 Tax=uncultured Alsobacter sp. TaxID=1748258 RepID=UPI0025DE628D|nr:hypothetical protein [uncultured Alsobacter sp.]